jgi:hypothetical protein
MIILFQKLDKNITVKHNSHLSLAKLYINYISSNGTVSWTEYFKSTYLESSGHSYTWQKETLSESHAE